MLILRHGSVVAFGEPHEVLTEGLIAEVYRVGVDVVVSSDGTRTVLFRRPSA